MSFSTQTSPTPRYRAEAPRTRESDVAERVRRILDPRRRAEAERLLQTIRQEEAARRRSRSRADEADRGEDTR